MKKPASIAAFGRHLRQLRETRGWSQQALADVTKKTVYRQATRQAAPTLDVLVCLAEGLEISLVELVTFPPAARFRPAAAAWPYLVFREGPGTLLHGLRLPQLRVLCRQELCPLADHTSLFSRLSPILLVANCPSTSKAFCPGERENDERG